MKYLLRYGKNYAYIKDIADESGIAIRNIYRRSRYPEVETTKIGKNLYIAVESIPRVTRPVERVTKPSPHEEGFLSCKELGRRAGMSRTQARNKIRFLFQKGLIRLYTDVDGNYDYTEDNSEVVKLVKKKWNLSGGCPEKSDGFYPIVSIHRYDTESRKNNLGSTTIYTRFKRMKETGLLEKGTDYKFMSFEDREIICISGELKKKLTYPKKHKRRIYEEDLSVMYQNSEFSKNIETLRTSMKGTDLGAILGRTPSIQNFKTVQNICYILDRLHQLKNGHQMGYYDSFFVRLFSGTIKRYGKKRMPSLAMNLTNRTKSIIQDSSTGQIDSFLNFADKTCARETESDEFVKRLFEWGHN